LRRDRRRRTITGRRLLQAFYAATVMEVPAPVVLITGASRGIGRALALHFAAEGARLALVARSESGLGETLDAARVAGAEADAFVADVTDAAAVAESVAHFGQALGPTDVLINNAGLGGPIGEMWELDPEEWWETVDVNLRGTFVCSHAVLPSMVERGRGRIVNVVSHAGIHRWPYFSSYVASKAAVIKLTETLASETRPHGIAVLAAHPGLVRAGLTDNRPADATPPPEGTIEHKVFMWFERQLAEGHTVSVEEAAAFLADVASGRADALSGRYVAIEDDLDALVEHATQVRRDNLQALKVERLGGQTPAGSNP
jgi:NAD(P)-dependent dehydrogenase (short-subunit alcohol dehydrogenase family)